MKHEIVKMRVLAFFVYEGHSGEVIFDTATGALDILCLPWRDIISGVSTDGKKMIKGRMFGMATRFYSVAKPSFVRVLVRCTST